MIATTGAASVGIPFDGEAIAAAFAQAACDGSFAPEFAAYLNELGATRLSVVLAFAPKAAGTYLRSAAVDACGGCRAALDALWQDRVQFRFNRAIAGRGTEQFGAARIARLRRQMAFYPGLAELRDRLIPLP